MTPYLRLLLILTWRSVTGRLACLVCATIPGLLALATIWTWTRGGASVPAEAFSSAFGFGAWLALAFSAVLTGAMIHGERLENRVGLLRVANLDGARAMVHCVLHGAVVAAVLGTLVTASAWAASARALATPIADVLWFGTGIVLAGASLAALGVLGIALVGRPVWIAIAGALSVIVATIVTASLVGGSPRPEIVAAAGGAAAAVAGAGVVATGALAQFLPSLASRTWR